MSDEKKIGYVLNHQFLLDRETNEGVTMTYNAPEDASALDLAMKMRTVSIACWTVQLANNQRVAERTKVVMAEADARMHEARVGKLKIDEKVLATQRVQQQTQLIMLEAEIAADQLTLEREQAMTPEQLAERVKTVQRSTFGTTH
jgi:hypothetical protein